MRRAFAAVLAALALLLTGCGFIGGLIETEEALESAGYANATVDYEEVSPGPGPVVLVTYDSTATSVEDLRAEAVGVAQIVWEKAPVRIAVLEVASNTGEIRTPTTFSRADLQRRFGPRPPGLKEQDFEDLGRSVITGFAIVGFVMFLVVVGVIVLIVVLVRRNRRNQAMQPAYAGDWSGAPGGPMWGQPQQPWGVPQQPQRPPPPPPGSWGAPPPPPPPPGNPNDPWAGPGGS